MASQNDFHCPLPWVHLSLEPDGNVYSCCNAIDYAPLGNIQNESLSEIQNGKKAQDLRDKFIKGSIPEQCRICIDQEKQGSLSLREASLRQFKDTHSDSIPVKEFLGLRFDNYCNYSCRICTPKLSTGWYKDHRTQLRPTPSGPILAIPKGKNKEFFENVNYDELKYIYLAGGEPFLSPDYELLLDFLEERNEYDIQFQINTNFSFPKKNRDKALARLDRFKDVFLNLSLDGMEERGDYMRKGQKWATIENDILFAKENFPSITLGIFVTVSVFNILHLERFIHYILGHELIEVGNIRINPLLEPDYYSIEMTPKTFKDEARKSISRLKKKVLSMDLGKQSIGLIKQLNGLLPSLDTPVDTERLTFFLKETTYLDSIREESFESLFTEEYNLLKL
jgi:radical SAM protein with 4Fe4S-binding SPASM domain